MSCNYLFLGCVPFPDWRYEEKYFSSVEIMALLGVFYKDNNTEMYDLAQLGFSLMLHKQYISGKGGFFREIPLIKTIGDVDNRSSGDSVYVSTLNLNPAIPELLYKANLADRGSYNKYQRTFRYKQDSFYSRAKDYVRTVTTDVHEFTKTDATNNIIYRFSFEPGSIRIIGGKAGKGAIPMITGGEKYTLNGVGEAIISPPIMLVFHPPVDIATGKEVSYKLRQTESFLYPILRAISLPSEVDQIVDLRHIQMLMPEPHSPTTGMAVPNTVTAPGFVTKQATGGVPNSNSTRRRGKRGASSISGPNVMNTAYGSVTTNTTGGAPSSKRVTRMRGVNGRVTARNARNARNISSSRNERRAVSRELFSDPFMTGLVASYTTPIVQSNLAGLPKGVTTFPATTSKLYGMAAAQMDPNQFRTSAAASLREPVQRISAANAKKTLSGSVVLPEKIPRTNFQKGMYSGRYKIPSAPGNYSDISDNSDFSNANI
jgi:hypothetical protein